MRLPPASVIQSWPKPNYINPDTRGPALVIVECIFMPLSVVCMVLRIWVRTRWLRSWWDDWAMLASTVFGVGLTICVILASQRYGWDIHVWDLGYNQIVAGRKISIAAQTLFLFASGTAKMSILLTYLRFAPDNSLFRRLVCVSLVLVTALIFIFLIVLWTQCLPASDYWDLLAPQRTCAQEGPPLLSQSIISTVLDGFLYFLPMPTLFSIKLPLKQRIGLMALFGLGSLVVVAGVVRTYYIHVVVYETYDVTWDGVYIWIWTAIEVNLGVICGCAPSLKPLMFRGRSSLRSTSFNESSTVRLQSNRMTPTPIVETAAKEADVVSISSTTRDVPILFIPSISDRVIHQEDNQLGSWYLAEEEDQP